MSVRLPRLFSLLLPLGVAAVVLPALFANGGRSAAAEANVVMPKPAFDTPAATATTETAILSGGCFWGIQGVFQHVNGVKRVVSGYAGGTRSSADYETVSSGMTKHAESVEITYDPKVVSYGQLLQVFFSVALDPTEVNQQGPDQGPQYRSEVFYNNDMQKKVAEGYIAQLNYAHVFTRPIATRVDPNSGFYAAEGYHQDYLVRNPNNPYIAYNDLPKVANLKRLFPSIYRTDPVLTNAKSS